LIFEKIKMSAEELKIILADQIDKFTHGGLRMPPEIMPGIIVKGWLHIHKYENYDFGGEYESTITDKRIYLSEFDLPNVYLHQGSMHKDIMNTVHECVLIYMNEKLYSIDEFGINTKIPINFPSNDAKNHTKKCGYKTFLNGKLYKVFENLDIVLETIEKLKLLDLILTCEKCDNLWFNNVTGEYNVL